MKEIKIQFDSTEVTNGFRGCGRASIGSMTTSWILGDTVQPTPELAMKNVMTRTPLLSLNPHITMAAGDILALPDVSDDPVVAVPVTIASVTEPAFDIDAIRELIKDPAAPGVRKRMEKIALIINGENNAETTEPEKETASN